MVNVFDALGRIGDFFGEGLATKSFGPGWEKKAALLARLNEAKTAGAEQDLSLKAEDQGLQRIDAAAKLAALGVSDLPENLTRDLSPVAVGQIKQEIEHQRSLREAEKLLPYKFETANNAANVAAAKERAKQHDELMRALHDNKSEPLMWVDQMDKDGKPVLDSSGNPMQELVPRSEAAGRTKARARPVSVVNKEQAYKSAQPVLKTISDLSSKIKVGEGPLATVVGLGRAGAAKINLDDDMNRYRAAVRGFAPLLARALGHTGVLTEQDVNRTEELFGKPQEGDKLRASKIKLVTDLLDAVKNTALPAPDEGTGFQTRLNAALGSVQGQGGTGGGVIDLEIGPDGQLRRKQ